jgi:HPt (histidine-containing phosphotransfer) domain-containing protein
MSATGLSGGLDWQRFVAVAADCEWSPDEMRRFYVDGTRGQLDELRAALDAGDAASLERLAHGCVGSSSTCGATGMVELFRELEAAAAAGRLETGAGLLAAAAERLEAVDRALGERIAGSPG